MELQKKKEKLSSAVGSVNKTCEVETQRAEPEAYFGNQEQISRL